MANAVPSMVADVLEDYGRMVRGAVEGYLPQGEPKRQLYDLVRDYPHRGGRMMRSVICLAAARAYNGSLYDGLRSAVCVELLHNAFLVHDDIEDDSDTRRGIPALHLQHGVPLAINAGDALFLLALRPLMENFDVLGMRSGRELLDQALHMAQQTVEGQAIELGWRRDNRLDLADDDYMDMVLRKTCWYSTIFPMRAGAIVAGLGPLPDDAFVRYGFLLGATFQIQDDLLNLAGDPVRYGKELSGDLLEGKRTLMLLHFARQAGPKEHVRLESLLATPRSERLPDDIAWLRESLDAAGSLEYARCVAQALAGAAEHEFALAFASAPESRDKEFLGSLPRWVIERS